MTTDTLPRTGARTELARYTARGHERVLHGQRVLGRVRITDSPATGHGRAYLVETGLEQDGYAALQATVHDYLSMASRYDRIPMTINPVDAQARSTPRFGPDR